jgi:ATP-binding cassette subfamily C protein CydC
MTRLARELRPIIGILSDNRSMLTAGLLLSATATVCGIALLGLSGWFITATAVAGFSAATALAFDVFVPSAGIRLLALARTAARYGERLTTHDATLGALAGLRVRLFRGWAEPGAASDLVKRPARLLFRLTLDIDALESLYLRVVVPIMGALVVALACALAFGLMHPLLGLAVAGFLVLAGIGVPLAAARAAKRPARRRAYALEILRARVIDLVTGQADLVMAGEIPARQKDLSDIDRYLSDSDDALNRIETAAGLGFGILGAMLLSGVLVAVAQLAEDGAIGAPVAVLGLMVALTALEPFAALRRGAVELGRTLLAARRIAPRLAVASPTFGSTTPPPDVAVCLDSITIRNGERIALIGPSGAGKSTLLAVIAGEIDPESGRIEQRAATLLTQRTELFQDSLRDNLRLADPEAGDARLLDVLDAAGLRRDVEALPQRLDTRLGEGGHGLSGGQARRLALARLFLRDTPLWLFDEPTEGLDGATARDVLARLDARAARRTIIIATHIGREAELADRLLILDRGRLAATVERGETGFEAALAGLRPD